MSLPTNIVDRILEPRPEDVESHLWNRHLFYPGRAFQPSEANEMETLIFNVIDKLGRTLFREGSTISGIELVQKANDKVQVTDGEMYIDGRVRTIAGTTTDLQLLGTGREYVGLVRAEIIRRPEEDLSLLEPQIAPTVGAQQFNLKGALRQIYQYTWVVINSLNPNPIAVPVFEFRNGNLLTSQSQGEYSTLLRVLNRRTFDEFGHFLVNGFLVNVAQSPVSEDKLLVRIDSGKAYVYGTEIQKNSSSIFEIDKALTTDFVESENIPFHTTPTSLLVYPLANGPVKSVTVIAAKVRRSWATGNGVRVIRSTTDPSDNLFSDTNVIPSISPNSAQKGIAIYQILKISNTQGGAANYTANVDYQQVGNAILWVSGNKPAPGQSYYVDLVLVRQLTHGKRVRVAVVNETIVHGSANGTDTIGHNDLIRITRVAMGPNPGDAVFVEGRDFTINSGRTATAKNLASLNWVPQSSDALEPPVGQTYVVSYEYWGHPIGFEGDVTTVDDYYDTDGTTKIPEFLASPYHYSDYDVSLENAVDLRCVQGDPPIDQTDINVQYFFYVPRRDTISLDAKGEFVIHKGVPNINPEYPPTAVSTLEIAKLDIPANSSNVLVTYPENRRMAITDLLSMRNMLYVQVYNAAIRYLESLAMFETTSASKKMVLVDPFIDFSRANFLYNKDVIFKASIDPENGALMLPQVFGSRKLVPLTFSGMSLDPYQANTSRFKSIAMTAFQEEDLITQPFATEHVDLNPDGSLGPICSIQLTPDQTFWADPSVTPDVRLGDRADSLIPVTQDDLRVESVRLTRVFGYVRKAFNRFWAGASRQIPWGGTGQLNQITSIYYPQVAVPNYTSDQIVGSKSMDRVNDRILDRSVAPMMDQQTVTISSDNWYPDVDDIEIYFDGVKVTVTPTDPLFGGTQAGTLKSDSQGNFSGTFAIPARTRAGRKIVQAIGQVPFTTDTITATAIFAAEGLRQVYNSSYVTINVVGTSESPDSTITRAEPYVQVFNANRDVPITGVILYFKKRPNPGSASDRPVFVQIRDLNDQGQPTSNILAQAVIRATDVTPSLDGSTETQIAFDDPVFVENGQSYALVITTDSNGYALFQSRLGSHDLLTGALVAQNADTGLVWRSAGGQTYTQDPFASLKYRIRYAAFSPNAQSSIVFRNITDLGLNQVLRDADGNVNIPRVPGQQGLLPNTYSKFLHIVSQYTPPGARVIWSYSKNAGVSWTPYTPGVEVDCGGAISQLQIKCETELQQVGGVTPSSAAISLVHNGLVLIGQEADGHYITFSTDLAQPASNVRVILVTDTPLANADPQSRVKVSYSVDGGTNWTSLDVTSTPTERVLTAPLLERRYDKTVAPFTKIAIRIDLYNSSTYSADPQVRAGRFIAY